MRQVCKHNSKSEEDKLTSSKTKEEVKTRRRETIKQFWVPHADVDMIDMWTKVKQVHIIIIYRKFIFLLL